VLVDFKPVFNKEMTLYDLANSCNANDLSGTLNSYIDCTLQIIDSVSDQQLFYVPLDPDANDPYAASEEERHVGWSIAHLVTHVTATVEEGAAFSSLLARGVSLGGRLRYEAAWQQFTTRNQVVTRLEECRRMCLAYLATWPDQPHLDTLREMPEHKRWLVVNAPTSFLAGLLHWHVHLAQFEQAAEQDHITHQHATIE